MTAPRRLALLLLAAATGCGSSGNTPCDPIAQAGCAAGLACEAVVGGSPGCFEPLFLDGVVRELGAATPTFVPGARIVALDQDRAPRSSVATSGSAGAWSVRVPATRDAAGTPVQASVTLRADAQGYAPFPSGLRTALPIDLAGATHDAANHRWTLSGALTTVDLLPAASGAAWLHGTVARAPGGAGALVVAEASPGGGEGHTAVADASGAYVIFNLAEGASYEVRAYAKGSNHAPVTTAALAAGDNAAAPLALAAGAGATLAGGLIFNNVSGPVGIALVVESTYLESLDRGETPPGLAVPSSSNGYTISGVPDGRYVVLAAYGIDGAVRDLSGGGNTAPVQVEVAGNAVVGSSPGFKVTGAVSLTSIDGQAVSGTPATVATATPEFAWAKASAYSSASTYRVKVYDAFGVQVWSEDQAAGNTNVATYAGAALQPGLPYQLRILAIAEAMPVPVGFTLLSQTEDLLGVFTYAPPPPP